MTTLMEIRDKVNSKIPGVGRGVVDYAIKKLNISNDTSNSEDIRKTIEEIIKHVQTLFGTEKADVIRKELSGY